MSSTQVVRPLRLRIECKTDGPPNRGVPRFLDLTLNRTWLTLN